MKRIPRLPSYLTPLGSLHGLAATDGNIGEINEILLCLTKRVGVYFVHRIGTDGFQQPGSGARSATRHRRSDVEFQFQAEDADDLQATSRKFGSMSVERAEVSPCASLSAAT
jgi:hypothetical protein